MFPTHDKLHEISRLREGGLRDIPYAILLSAFAAFRRTLVLDIQRSPAVRSIVLMSGIPVDCYSNMAQETFERFLVSRELLTEEELEKHLDTADRRGIPFEQVLVDAGVRTGEEVIRDQQQCLAKKLLAPFSFREGDFETTLQIPEVPSPLMMNVPRLIVTGISRFSPQEHVDAAVGPLVGKRLGLHPDPLFSADDLKLTPLLTKVTKSLRRRQRMDELAASTGIAPEELSRLLFTLGVLGVVAPEDCLPPEAAPQKAPTAERAPPLAPAAPNATAPAALPAPPAPPPAPAAPAAPSSAEIARNALTALYPEFGQKNPFQLLGVSEDASPPAIQSRFLEFARLFAPWDYSGPELGPLSDKARDVFCAGAVAFAELHDPERLAALRRRRVGGRALVAKAGRPPAAVAPPAPASLPALRRPPSGTAFRIRTDLLDPAVQFRNGQRLMAAGRYRDALTVFEFVCNCDPQNAAFNAEAAWCRYLEFPSLTSQPLRELKEVLRMDPQCGVAAYYAGEIHRRAGNRAEAEPYLRRAAKLMSKDARPAEALKLLSEKSRR